MLESEGKKTPMMQAETGGSKDGGDYIMGSVQ